MHRNCFYILRKSCLSLQLDATESGSALMTTDWFTVVLRPGLESQRWLFPHFFLTNTELWLLTFYLRRLQWQLNTKPKWHFPKLSRKCAISPQPLAPWGNFSSTTTLLPTTPRSPKPSRVSKEFLFQTTNTTAPTSHPATSGFLWSIKTDSMGTSLNTCRTSQKQWNHSLTLYQRRTTKRVLWTWHKRLEALWVKGEYYKGMWR